MLIAQVFTFRQADNLHSIERLSSSWRPLLGCQPLYQPSPCGIAGRLV